MVKDKSIESIIKNIKESDLRIFLTNLLEEDEKVLDRFKIHFISEFPTPTISDYKSRIYLAIREVAGRDGFIDYSEASNYVNAMYTFIEEAQILIDKELFELAFDIITLILDEIPDLAIDDSGGETSCVSDECIGIIKKILELCDNEKVLNKILNYICNELTTQTLSNYGVELYELINWFIQNKLYLDKIEKTLLDAIENGKDKKYFFNHDDYVNSLTNIYKMMDRNDKAIDLIKNNLSDYKILLKYVDILINEQNYDEAIKSLKNGIERDFHGHLGIVIKLSTKLLSIYKEQNMLEEYKLQLYTHFFNYEKYDLDIFKEIKRLYRKEDWPMECDTILNRIPSIDKTRTNANVMKLYIEENMIDALFTLLKDCFDFSTIQRYEKYLYNKYTDEIYELYFRAIRMHANNVSSRTHYRELAHELAYLKSKSNEKVHHLISEITIQYSNRPAMMDEFKKANLY